MSQVKLKMPNVRLTVSGAEASGTPSGPSPAWGTRKRPPARIDTETAGTHHTGHF